MYSTLQIQGIKQTRLRLNKTRLTACLGLRLAVRVSVFRVCSIRLTFESKRVYSQLAASETYTSLRVYSLAWPRPHLTRTGGLHALAS